MIHLITPKRGTDNWGSGEFGAPRGDRKHRGIDYAALPGSLVLSPVTGTVTKLGYPYSDDLEFRYVQITSEDGADHRVFYVDPNVKVGDRVFQGRSVIGEAQDLTGRYPGITPHVHYEIKLNGSYIDPEAY